MDEILSIRMDDQLSSIVDGFLKEQHLEKSEAIRQLIVKGVYMSAIQTYLEHKISVQKAASICHMPLSEFMDFLGKLGIGSQLDLEDMQTGYEDLQHLK